MTTKFNSVEEVNGLFDNWHNLSEIKRLQVIRDLREDGQLSVVTQPKITDSKCPIHNFGLIRPCSLSKCYLYKESSCDKNCLFNAITQSKHGRLNPDEISKILGMSVKEVNSLHGEALRKVQIQQIKEVLDLLRVPRYKFLKYHCVSCEMNILNDMEMGLDQQLSIDEFPQFGYCSQDCLDSMPNWQFKLEFEFNCNFMSVLKAAYSMPSLAGNKVFQKIDTVLDLDQGISKSYLT